MIHFRHAAKTHYIAPVAHSASNIDPVAVLIRARFSDGDLFKIVYFYWVAVCSTGQKYDNQRERRTVKCFFGVSSDQCFYLPPAKGMLGLANVLPIF